MQKIPEAFAVKPIPVKRFEASKGPLSPSWTLYDSSKLLEDLNNQGYNIDQNTLDNLLEQNGFNKAVRIREEVLKYKERLRIEFFNLEKLKIEYTKNINKIKNKQERVQEQLENCRNILRLQRENPNNDS